MGNSRPEVIVSNFHVLWPLVGACYSVPMVRGKMNPLHFGLAARLKQARRQSGLKRLPLSEKGGISDTTIADIEAGTQTPTVGMIARLATALSVAAHWLAYGLGDETAEATPATCDGMGARLQLARTTQGHTKASLARLAELNPGTIGGIERGGQAGVDTIEALAKALGVSPGWLAYGVGPMEPPSRRRTPRPAAASAR